MTIHQTGRHIVAIDKRGAIIARNCPLSIARPIAERAAYASALASAADTECGA